MQFRPYILTIVFTASLLFAVSCTKDSTPIAEEALPTAGSSYALLQEKIITPNCATSGCHDTKTKSNGLDLSAANSYKNLVGVEPTNENALKDKFLRVKAGNPYQSFLYIKLDSTNFHQSDGYGSLMPLGSRPITVGQVEFVKQWIAAGAPKNDVVADAKLLDDSRSQNEALFLSLPPQGKQFKVSPFGVPPQFERELFIAQQNTEDLYMTKFEMIQRDRSHHFILYGYDPAKAPTTGLPKVGVIRDLYDGKGNYDFTRFLEMQNRIYIIGSQLKTETISFPEGMALKIPANYLLDFNSHYTNGTRDTTRGEVLFNIHTIPASQVKNIIKPLQLGNTSISLPPKQEKTIETTFMVGGSSAPGGDKFDRSDSVYYILGLTSHFHKLGKKFVVQIVGGSRNGEVIYSCTNWLNPPLVQYKDPLMLRRGEGLKSIVTWYNETDKTVSFGFRSEDEMNFVFGYYYN